MPHIVKRGPADDDLGQVTVIDEQPGTVHRFKFEVTAKNRANFRRTKGDRADYGAGATESDQGGICAGETLVLTTHMSIVEGRQAQVAADVVPKHVVDELHAAGADEVRA